MRLRSAFSLIELLAVLTLISLVAISVSVRWSNTYSLVKFDAAIAELVDFDAASRDAASRQGSVGELVVDLQTQQLQGTRWNRGQPSLKSLAFPESISIGEFWSVNGEELEGAFQLFVDRDGASVSYGLGLSQGDTQRWVIFAGRTGQPLFYESEQDVKTFFDRLQDQRTDIN